MIRIWVMLKKHNKIIRDTVIETDPPVQEGDFTALFERIGEALDVASPVMLGKHRRELEQFYHTRFFPADFMEPVNFDCMELEILVDKSKAHP